MPEMWLKSEWLEALLKIASACGLAETSGFRTSRVLSAEWPNAKDSRVCPLAKSAQNHRFPSRFLGAVNKRIGCCQRGTPYTYTDELCCGTGSHPGTCRPGRPMTARAGAAFIKRVVG